MQNGVCAVSRYLGFDPTDNPYYFFVSYNNEDANRVSGLACAMHDAGIPLWYDYGLEYGEKWAWQINEKIANAQAVILLLTKGILQKKKSYVRKEYKIAVEAGTKIIVLFVDEIDKKDVPVWNLDWWVDIKEKHCLDIYPLKDRNELIKEVKRALGLREGGEIAITQQTVPQPRDSGKTVADEKSKPQPAKQGSKRLLTGILCAALLMVCAALAFFLLPKSNPDEDKAASRNTPAVTETAAPAADPTEGSETADGKDSSAEGKTDTLKTLYEGDGLKVEGYDPDVTWNAVQAWNSYYQTNQKHISLSKATLGSNNNLSFIRTTYNKEGEEREYPSGLIDDKTASVIITFEAYQKQYAFYTSDARTFLELTKVTFRDDENRIFHTAYANAKSSDSANKSTFRIDGEDMLKLLGMDQFQITFSYRDNTSRTALITKENYQYLYDMVSCLCDIQLYSHETSPLYLNKTLLPDSQ